MSEKKVRIFVKTIEGNEIVNTLDVTDKSPPSRDRVVRGMLINLNHEVYYVDDSECIKAESVGG